MLGTLREVFYTSALLVMMNVFTREIREGEDDVGVRRLRRRLGSLRMELSASPDVT
jgi:hypothetical protein